MYIAYSFSVSSLLFCFRLSVFNLLLIGIINMYVILTGGLCIIQFTYFRKSELKLSIVSIPYSSVYMVSPSSVSVGFLLNTLVRGVCDNNCRMKFSEKQKKIRMSSA